MRSLKKAKKETQARKLANQEFARCHPGPAAVTLGTLRTQLHDGEGRVSSCNPERLSRREERNQKINLIHNNELLIQFNLIIESKNLFYFSPLLHVYSGNGHALGDLPRPTTTTTA
jgi:hypothetical protein